MADFVLGKDPSWSVALAGTLGDKTSSEKQGLDGSTSKSDEEDDTPTQVPSINLNSMEM